MTKLDTKGRKVPTRTGMTLDQLVDVSTPTPVVGQFLTWVGGILGWSPVTYISNRVALVRYTGTSLTVDEDTEVVIFTTYAPSVCYLDNSKTSERTHIIKHSWDSTGTLSVEVVGPTSSGIDGNSAVAIPVGSAIKVAYSDLDWHIV